MSLINILTATYNHGQLLNTLYQSLLRQNNKNFTWIVVNDGSTDDTGAVVRKMIEEKRIDIRLIEKQNGGKSSAINLGFDNIDPECMVAIVDDDENLEPDAVEVLMEYRERYYGSETAIFCFNRIEITTGLPMANFTQKEEMTESFVQFTREGKMIDGYLAYFDYAIRRNRFPIYPGEKYIGPSVMLIMCGERYKMLWSLKALGKGEYLAGGITKQGRSLRLKNPCGMIYRCIQFQCAEAGFKTRMKYSIMGYGYQYFAKLTDSQLKDREVEIEKLCPWMKLPGLLLAMIWRRKYPMIHG